MSNVCQQAAQHSSSSQCNHYMMCGLPGYFRRIFKTSRGYYCRRSFGGILIRFQSSTTFIIRCYLQNCAVKQCRSSLCCIAKMSDLASSSLANQYCETLDQQYAGLSVVQHNVGFLIVYKMYTKCLHKLKCSVWGCLACQQATDLNYCNVMSYQLTYTS